MNNNAYKNKKIIILILSILLVIGLGCIALLAFMEQKVSTAPSYEDAVEVLDIKTMNIAENSIEHKTDFIKVDVTFTKKVVPVYTPPKTPDIGDGTKYCVLTFDDGPGIGSTQRILNVLAKYNIKGTWFVLGSRVYSYSDMAKKIASAGHEIANHSYSHPDLLTLSYDGYMKEINNTQAAIKSVTGNTSVLLRPPYGSYSAEIAANCGLSIALWNVDSLDWSHRYAPAIYNEVLTHLNTHSVILFHDIYDFTAEAVEMIVPKLVEMGYKFITYSQYLQLS